MTVKRMEKLTKKITMKTLNLKNNCYDNVTCNLRSIASLSENAIFWRALKASFQQTVTD